MRDSHRMSAPPDLPDDRVAAPSTSPARPATSSFCRNETGRLLATLAATRGGTMAEFGTGCGVGTAWLRSRRTRRTPGSSPPSSTPKLAGAAAEIFDDDDQVEVLAADWSTLLDKGPFSLLFLDSGEPTDGRRRRRSSTWSSPAASWCSTTSRRASRGRRSPTGRVDTLREQWLTDERFTAVEVMVAADASALIATQR